MFKPVEELGRYMSVKVCKQCGWYDKPPELPFPALTYHVCPECGSHDLDYQVGRYKFMVWPGGLFRTRRVEILGFVRHVDSPQWDLRELPADSRDPTVTEKVVVILHPDGKSATAKVHRKDGSVSSYELTQWWGGKPIIPQPAPLRNDSGIPDWQKPG